MLPLHLGLIKSQVIDYISPPDAITGIFRSREEVVEGSTDAHAVAIKKYLTFVVMMMRTVFLCLCLNSLCFMLELFNHQFLHSFLANIMARAILIPRGRHRDTL
jgi:hypothetical protein